MEKESYNIDDILSEVKKRREEQERALKGEKPFEEEKQPKTAEAAKEEEKVSSQKENSQPQKKNPLKVEGEEKPAQEKAEFNETVISKKNDKKDNPPIKSEKKEKPVKKVEKAEEVEVKQKPEEEQSESEMVDFLKLSQITDEQLIFEVNEEKPVKQKFFKTKKGKIVKAVIIVLVILIVAAGIFAALYLNNILNGVVDKDGNQPYKAVEYYDGMDFLQEDFPMIEEQSAYDVYSYKEYLKQWYQNGDPVRSSHVLNILLIGEDTREEEITDTSRADSAIIASINIDTGTIHLTSILRDLYVYYEVNGEGHYGKINESASMGGMNTYITTLERYYKISIDNYAVVNFASFPKIIDALGGVEIALTNAEVREVNNHQVRYAHVTLPEAQFDENGEPLKVKLTGEQALAYCRIRKIDSDNARADRQKTVLNELFSKMKSSGAVDAVKVVNQLSQYTKTGYTKKELISIGNLALKDGWLSYGVKTTNVPAVENSKGGQNFSVAPGNWIWLADIPKDANELQMLIYGKSNIKLNENRPDYIAMGR